MSKLKLIKITLFLTLFISIQANAQMKFFNYTNPNNVTSIEDDGNYFWVGTSGGLYKWHKNGTLLFKFDSDNGLPSNFINCVKIDDYSGGLWVGTMNGVAKLDGTTWTIYNQSNGLVNNPVYSIAIDQQGNKWFGTYGGISKFDGVTWTTYTTANGLVNNKVSDIAVDILGNKWFGTYAGVSKFDGTIWTNYTTANGLANDTITSIAIDSQGKKWFGTISAGVSVFNGSTWVTYNETNGLSYNKVYDIKIDASGIKWIIGYGVNKFDETNWTQYFIEDGLSDNEVRSITVDANGNKWFATSNGISKFDGINWTTYLNSLGLVSNTVRKVFIDSNGNKWFGTDSGISKFTGSDWFTYNTANGFSNNYIRSFAEDNLGNIWAGTWYGGVCFFNGSTWTNYTTSNGLINNFVQAIAIDSQNNKWFGTATGISKFNGTTWINYTTSNGLVNNVVNAIAIDAQGNKWFGTDGGVSKFDGTNWTTFTSTQGLISNKVYAINIEYNGNIWFGTNAGVSKYDGSTWTSFTTTNGLCHNDVRSIAIDSSGNKWFGTWWGGVSKYDNNNWKTYNETNDIMGLIVPSIVIDSYGNKWMGTLAGVSRVSCEAPIANFSADTICLPQSTTFTNQTTRTDVFTTYEWDINNDGSVEYTNQNINHVFSASGTYQVKLTASNETCTASVVKTIKVNSTPIVSIETQGNTHVCKGGAVNLQAQVSNLQSGNTYNYLWSDGSIGQTIIADTTNTFIVTVTNENCSAISANSIDVVVQTPYVNEKICIVTVDTIEWKNKVLWKKTPDVGTDKYIIYKENNNASYDSIGEVPYNDASFFIDYSSTPESNSDRYKIAIKDTCGNKSIMSKYHNTINLVISTFGSTMGLSWTHYSTEDLSYVPAYYNIYKGTSLNNMQLLTTRPGSQNTYNDNNVFELNYYMIGVQRDCNTEPAYSNKRSNGVGISSNPFTYGTLQIAPNPMSSITTITIPNAKITNCELKIIDITGKVIRSISKNEISQLPNFSLLPFTFTLNREDLKAGLYFVEIKGDRVYRGKLVVE